MLAPDESALRVRELVATYNDMGFRLLALHRQERPQANIMLSPFGIALALCMVYNGAEGATARALAQALGVEGMDLQAINEANAALIAMQDDLDSKALLRIANAIWLQSGGDVAQDFIRRTETYYQAVLRLLDFGDPDAAAETINRWVSAKTKITRLVAPQHLLEAVMVLTNAVYFKGVWARRFDPQRTRKAPFTLPDGRQKMHPLMRQSGQYRYFEHESFQAASLPFGPGRMSMEILLPKPDVSIDVVGENFSRKSWQEWTGQFRMREGDIAIPRFKLEYSDESMREHLIALSSPQLAGPDFLRMGTKGPLIINRIIHKSCLQVNEEGGEAAAATAVTMPRGVGIARRERFQMIVDRPFFCAIRCNETGLVLFMGFVMEPHV